MFNSKHSISIAIIMAGLGLFSCEKESIQISDKQERQNSDYELVKEFTYSEELVVYDDEGKNSIYVRVSSNKNGAVDDFILNNQISFTTTSELKGVQTDNLGKPTNAEDVENFKDDGPEINIDVVHKNIISDDKFMMLKVQEKEDNLAKSYTPWTMGSYTFDSDGDVIGAIHDGSSEYSFMCRYWYKKSALGLWKEATYNGANAWLVNPSLNYYSYYNFSNSSTHKIRMNLRPDYRQQSAVNYIVIYSLDEYTRDCPLGSYDMNNYGECYVATAPVGSNAFVYDYSGNGTDRWYMYTPVNGTCPWLPEVGSGFDGANCRAIKIPSNVINNAYTWQRNFLLKSNKLNQ